MGVKFDLILDVRSGSVGVCAFTREKKATVPTCLFAARVKIPLQKEFDGGRGLSDLSGGIKLALEALRKHLPGHPHSVNVAIGTPWYLSQSRTVIFKGEVPITVNEKLIDKLLESEVEAFAKEYYSDQKAGIVEKAVMKISLNGYPTTKPYGKMAKEIDVTFHLSMTSQDLLEIIRKEFGMVYYHKDINYNTFTFAAWQAARVTILAGQPDLTFIDIGGEVSEWTLIERECLVESISFPIGAHSIIRDISSAFHVELEEARTLYEAYQEKRVSMAVDKKISEILSGVRAKWLTYISGIIQKLSNTHIIPTKFCVVGLPETARLFCEALGSPEVQALSVVPGTNVCVLPTSADLAQYYQGASLGRPDVFLALELIFIDKYVSML